MALINRISRLFKADFHAVLDQIEEPEALLKQAIRDMEDDLAGSEQSIANSLHQQDVMAARRDEIHTSVNDLDQQLDFCFESGKEDLSRSLIRKKLEAERLLKRALEMAPENGFYLDSLGWIYYQKGEPERAIELIRRAVQWILQEG